MAMKSKPLNKPQRPGTRKLGSQVPINGDPGGRFTVPRERTFNGKKFELDRALATKPIADQAVQRIRSETIRGQKRLARIIKIQDTYIIYSTGGSVRIG